MAATAQNILGRDEALGRMKRSASGNYVNNAGSASLEPAYEAGGLL